MKRAKFLFLILAIAIGVFLVNERDTQNLDNNNQDSSVLGEPAPFPNSFDTTYKAQNLRILWHEVDNAQSLSLFPNFTNSTSAKQAFQNNNCSLLVNGGFYTTSFEPTGLFISNGKTVKNKVSASLTNGFFSINTFGTARITPDLPKDTLVHALQSGPLLIYNGQLQKTTNTSDKNARRIIVATTGKNKVIFLAIYAPQSAFSGPILSDTPEILSLFEKNTGIKLADALNLDGGSASAFITNEISLSELSPIGSYFCLQ